MTWMRRSPWVAMLAITWFFGFSGQTVGGPGDSSEDYEPPPSVSASVNWAEETMLVEASGPPLGIGLFRGFLVNLAVPAEPITFAFPIAFDGFGRFELGGTLHGFDAIPSCVLVFTVETLNQCGQTQLAPPWGLRMQRFASNDPLAPMAPGGASYSAPIAGTTAPLWPVTVANIVAPAIGGTGTDHLNFLCSITGVEGVLPVH